MTRLALFLSLLVAMTIACGVTAPAPAVNTVEPVHTMTAESEIDLVKPLRNDGNSPNPTPAMNYVTASRSVYIRAEPNHTAEIVGHLMNGEDVTVLECFGIWARIGSARWTNSYYLADRCE